MNILNNLKHIEKVVMSCQTKEQFYVVRFWIKELNKKMEKSNHSKYSFYIYTNNLLKDQTEYLEKKFGYIIL